MCNLAVCRKWRNQGLAKALVAKCEEQVLEWDHTELHLKARQVNVAAVALYKSLGYEVESEAFDTEYMDHLVVMKKNITRHAKHESDASEKEAVFGAEERSLSSRS
jgi:ribosomal protein S18 acetylase RimI-like enzyme